MEAGEKIGSYRVVRLLGRGGMSEVYEVEHEALRKRLALKLFTADGAFADQLRTRFLAEGRVLCFFNDPHLVHTYDLAVEPASGRPYYVTDLYLDADGSPATLAAAQAKGEVSETRLLCWYGDLRAALDVIHAAGVVHRDLKPGNVLLDADDHARLADFGVARFTGPLRETLEVDVTQAVADDGRRMLLGTNRFLAPEVRAGGEASPASDYWSLGATLFLLLTGFGYEPGMDLAQMLAPFDPRWRDVFAGLLAADPAARRMPPIAEEAPPAWNVRVPRRLLLPAAAVLALLLAGVGAWQGVRVLSAPRAETEADRAAFCRAVLDELPSYLR